MNKTSFDTVASRYDEELVRGLSVTGAGKDFYAQKRVERLVEFLPGKMKFDHILDYGCGTGGSMGHLARCFSPTRITGVDVSEKSLEEARALFHNLPATFCRPDAYKDANAVDLAFCNGVFHHIPPAERPGAFSFVYRALKPGGWFAFWENNPWNPGTRYVMSRISFDRDAVTITPPEARGLLQAAGFVNRGFTSLFLFPSWLPAPAWLERALLRFPIGAQYLVLAQKPG